MLVQAQLAMTWDASAAASSVTAEKALRRKELGFAVITADSPPKDVIVGRILQGQTGS